MLSPIGPCTIWEGHCGAWYFPPGLTVASGAMGTGLRRCPPGRGGERTCPGGLRLASGGA